jgi:hypothetical protein
MMEIHKIPWFQTTNQSSMNSCVSPFVMVNYQSTKKQFGNDEQFANWKITISNRQIIEQNECV